MLFNCYSKTHQNNAVTHYCIIPKIIHTVILIHQYYYLISVVGSLFYGTVISKHSNVTPYI